MNIKRFWSILAILVAFTFALPALSGAFTYKDKVREPAMRDVMSRINDEITATQYATTGGIYYVDSGIGSNAASGGKENPVATIDYAIGLCTANNGDIIFVYPGHAESLGDAQIAADVAGITIVCLGNGANRATLTMTHANSSIDVTVANVSIVGLRLYSTTANSAIGIDLAVGADNFVLDRALFTDTGGFEFTISVDLKTGANNVTVSGCEFISASAGATASINAATGVVDRLKIIGNRFWTDASNAVIYSDQINTDMLIEGNVITNNNTGEFAIELSAAATGELVNNALFTDAWATMLDPGSLKCFGNTGVIAVDTAAITVPLGDYLSGGGTAPGTVLPASTSLYDTTINVNTVGVIAAPVASTLADTLHKDGSFTYDNTTDSLEALGTKTTDIDTNVDIISAAARSSFSHPNYLAVATGTFDTSGTWSTVGAHEIAVVTGMVRMLVIAECVTSVTSTSDLGTISLGDEVSVASVIAASTLGASAMVAGELWVDATLTRTILTRTQLNAIEFVVAGGQDIGYTVADNAITGGSMIFHIYWTPLDATGAVTAGAGGVF